MIRVGVFGAPVSRPLDFAEALLATELAGAAQDAEEMGRFRVFVVERPDLRLVVAIPPRHDAAEMFAQVLASSDAAILIVAEGAWREQESAVRAFESAHARHPVPLVRVVNAFLPPRAAADLPPERAEGALRGRLCWWRHEKTGAELASAALSAAVAAASG